MGERVSLFIILCSLLSPVTPILCEGDVRLVAERGVANWVLGRPQIFINGTWQQICAAGFEARDSDVVCRQLGHGAGTVLPFFNVPPDASDNVRGPPLPVGVLVAGCDGTEEALLECRTGSRDFLPWEFSERTGVITGCMTRSNPGLGIACVAHEEQGVVRCSATVFPWSTPLNTCSVRVPPVCIVTGIGTACGERADVEQYIERTVTAVRSSVMWETCSGEELALRLVGGEAMPDTAFGVPEIFHSGAWGSFCNGDIYRVLEYQFFLNLPYTQVRPLPQIRNSAAARTRSYVAKLMLASGLRPSIHVIVHPVALSPACSLLYHRHTAASACSVISTRDRAGMLPVFSCTASDAHGNDITSRVDANELIFNSGCYSHAAEAGAYSLWAYGGLRLPIATSYVRALP